jgi:hypothetical protein
MSSLAIAYLSPKAYYETKFPVAPREYDLEEDISKKAVAVEGSSAILDPEYMKTGQYYCVQIDNVPYLYRKINDHEIEVYGLAEQN